MNYFIPLLKKECNAKTDQVIWIFAIAAYPPWKAPGGVL